MTRRARLAVLTCCLVIGPVATAIVAGASPGGVLRSARAATLPLVFEPAAGSGSSAPRAFVARDGHVTLVTEGARTIIAFADGRTPVPTVVRMTLLDTVPAAAPYGEQRLAGHTNYVIGHDASAWRLGVPHYRRVRTPGIYPGIDLLFHPTGGEIEFDFLLQPGADPSRISWDVESAGDVRLNSEGDLVLTVAGHTVTCRKPVVYQPTAAGRRPVDAAFALRGPADAKATVVGFRLGPHDPALPLVIDPILTFATYLGGPDQDRISAVAAGPGGADYITGTMNLVYTTGPDFYFDARSDGFVAKLNAAGSAFDYLTVFGGERSEAGHALALGPEERVWVAGVTTSADFPTRAPMFPLQAGQSCPTIFGANRPCSDAFLMELDAAGAITWATPIGGRFSDSAIDMALDGSSGVYLTGFTDSADFPGGGPPRSRWGDAWVARVDIASRSMTYVFRLPAYTRTQAIAVDAAGAAYVTGYVVDTTSDLSRFTATPGAVQPTYAGDTCSYFRGILSGQCGDVFVARLSSDGTSMEYATFLGGADDDVATDIAVDRRGAVTIGGWTRSKDFPTSCAIQSSNRSGPSTDLGYNDWGRDAFVARLSPDGTVLDVSTYLGGVGDDAAVALARSADGSLLIAGVAGSLDLPGDALPGVPDPGVLFVSTHANHWAGIGLGLPVASVTLYPHPGRPGTLYAFTSGASSGRPMDLFRSRDAGYSWQVVTPPLPAGYSVYAGAEVFLDPARPDVVFARVGGDVHRSRDGGDTWTRVQGPMPGAAFDFFLALGPTLYGRSVPTGAPAGGLSRSEDDGATWTALDPAPGAGARIVGTAFQPGTIYAVNYTSLFRSTDAGRSFALVNDTLGGWAGRTLLVHPSNPNVLYAADGTVADEPLRTGDGGSTWHPFREGLPAGAAHLLGIDHQPPHTLYALASTQRVFGRTEGTIWVEEPGPGPATSAMARVAIGNGPARVYAVVRPSAARSNWFIARLTADDTRLDDATRVAPAEWAYSQVAGALAVNDAGTITLAGSSTSSALQTTPGAVQSTYGGSIDGILLRLAPWSSAADGDGDGLPDAWAVATGLAASAERAPDADPDDDGLTNREEAAAGSHPLGFVRRYLAEGSTGAFFDTEIAVANLSSTETAHVLLRWQRDDGFEATTPLEVPPQSRRTADPERVAGFENAAFSTLVESDLEVLVDRRMRWDASGYGSHLEQAVLEPSTTWYFAEGATHSGFDLFYLVQNPGDSAATVRVTYLRPAPEPAVERVYVVPAHNRYTIWVDAEGPELVSTDASAIVRSDAPVVVERAMYLSGAGRQFAAGHVSAGVTAPSTMWSFAEGATGSFFDTFLLVANPDERAAEIEVYFKPVGRIISKRYTIAPGSRLTIWVDHQDPQLADTALSAMVYVTNGVPVVAERAMWWPGPTAETWTEAHGSFGSPVVSAVWGIADGEVGGPDHADTYILVTDSIPGYPFTVTLFFDDGTTAQRTYRSTGRFNIPVSVEFPEARGRRFSAMIVSPYRKYTSSPEASWGSAMVVERALYSDADGVFWASGSAALATNLVRHLVFLDGRWHPEEVEVTLGSSVWFVDPSFGPALTVGPDSSAAVAGCAEVAAVGTLKPGVPQVSGQFRERKTCAWVADAGPQFPGVRWRGRIVVR